MAQKRLHDRLLELSSDPITVHEVTAAGVCDRYVDANVAACRLLGYARAELLRLRPQDLAAPGEVGLGAIEEEALRGEPIRSRTVRLRTKDGRVLAVEARCVLVEDAPGRKLVVSLLHDLAPCWQPGDTQQTFLALLHMAPDAILVTDAERRIVFWNEGAEATYGWTRGEALGHSPRELLKTRDHSPPVPDRVASSVDERGHWEGEVTQTCKSGREIRVASRWQLQRDSLGRLLGVIGINRDITGQVETREQMQHLRWLESVSRLVAGLAHDFNNRMAVILSRAEELRRELATSAPSLRKLADEIVDVGSGSKEMTRKLVAFAGALPESTTASDLNEVLRRCQRALRKTLPEDVELVVRLEPSLWPVTCDPSGVERAIGSLAANAREAMSRGGRLTLASANVEVRQALVDRYPFLRPGPHVRLTVADTGMGMTPEVRTHIFEPFFTTKPQGQGVGLGLATAYSLVRQSGGSIVLESEEGRGTTLELYFPRAPESAPSSGEA